MSHKYTIEEIYNAKIQVLDRKLQSVGLKIKEEELQEQALTLLNSAKTDHNFKEEFEAPEVEKLDG